jgi:hypothetical protein
MGTARIGQAREAMNTGRVALTLAGAASLGVGLLHVAMVFVGAPAYRYFGAGERFAQRAESGSFWPPLITLVLAAIFLAWGCFGLSGAGRMPRLPLLRLGLVFIGSVYTLRGVSALFQIAHLVRAPDPVLARNATFSTVSLAIGLLFLFGTVRAWPTLAPRSGTSVS